MNALSPTVAIVLRCKNNEWVLDRTLAALFAQTFTDFELVVVDSGSTDRTLEQVAPYPHRLITIAPEDYIPGVVLNQAIAQTSAPLVLFVNADCVLATPTALAALVAAFDNPDVMAAFGRQVPRPEAERWVQRDYAAAFPDTAEAPEWLPLSLPVAGMRRVAWEQQPFYTESWGSEDTHWGKCARERGWKIAYIPDAVAMHSHNYTPRQLYGRRFIEGEADAFIYGGGDSWWGLTRRLVSDLARRDKSLPLVWAGQWAYFQGRRHGARRQREGNKDLRQGQQTVLQRHESVREGG